MEFKITRAGIEDTELIAAIIAKSYDSLENKDWFLADDAEYVRNLFLDKAGIVWLATETVSGRPAGIFMSAFEGETEKCLGWDIGFSAEQCKECATMDSVAVLPEFRGFHLQYQLMQHGEQELTAMGFRYLMATVHPDNHASKDTMLLLGYRVMRTMIKYDGYLRDVMLKETK